VTIAKNYLNKEELEALNLIVSAYLDFAELQARGHRPMYMREWIAKLDDFLRLTDRPMRVVCRRDAVEAVQIAD